MGIAVADGVLHKDMLKSDFGQILQVLKIPKTANSIRSYDGIEHVQNINLQGVDFEIPIFYQSGNSILDCHRLFDQRSVSRCLDHVV
jgi:hypothetical protein